MREYKSLTEFEYVDRSGNRILMWTILLTCDHGKGKASNLAVLELYPRSIRQILNEHAEKVFKISPGVYVDYEQHNECWWCFMPCPPRNYEKLKPYVRTLVEQGVIKAGTPVEVITAEKRSPGTIRQDLYEISASAVADFKKTVTALDEVWQANLTCPKCKATYQLDLKKVKPLLDNMATRGQKKTTIQLLMQYQKQMAQQD